jgi:hypothetical protein
MVKPTNTNSDNPDEISINEILNRSRSFLNYLKNKWLTILIIALVGGLSGLAYSIFKKVTYFADSTFVLDEGDKSDGLGQYADLASLAGVSLGGGGGLFEGDNILQLYKSRLMISKTLLSVYNFNGKNQLLIDRYIDFNHMRTKWKSKDDIDTINFNGDPDKFNRKQDSIISDLTKTFDTKYLNVDKPDKKLILACYPLRLKLAAHRL